MPNRGKQKKDGCGHPFVWAFLTLLTFPVVLITTDMLGAGGLWPFALAVVATLLVLALEAAIRGKLWPFEPQFAECLGHPETPVRILVFMGGVLLILETALILTAATDLRSDPALIGLVMRKECAVRHLAGPDMFCRALTGEGAAPVAVQTKPRDAVSFAIRMRAANAWFPNETLATCSQRVAQQATDNQSVRAVSLVHCTAWRVASNGILTAKSSKTGFAALSMTRDQDGMYRVGVWSDNINDPSWDAALGDRAEAGRDVVRTTGIPPNLVTALQAEALGRAQQTFRQ
jgi:hypothetical protein